MREIDVRCAVCGTLQRTGELTSTSSFGPPDLDLRPNGPARWALPFRVQRCEACGYSARSIGSAPPQAGEVVHSRDLPRRARAVQAAWSRASVFLCAALIAEAAGDHESSGWAFLSAAWVCDDGDLAGRARTCRERAAEMFSLGLELGQLEMPPTVALTLIGELWRRAGRFEAALASCDAAAELAPRGRTPRALRRTSSHAAPGSPPVSTIQMCGRSSPGRRATRRPSSNAATACGRNASTRARSSVSSSSRPARPTRGGRRVGATWRMRSCGHHPGRRTDAPARNHHDRSTNHLGCTFRPSS